MKKIAIVCSGGDCQGMNTAIKTIVNMCDFYDIKVVGVRYGFQGLIDNDIEELTNAVVNNIADQGGCYLKVSRSKGFYTKAGIEKSVKTLIDNKIDGVILIGGDGSYRGSLELVKRGIKIIVLPGTIDNDLFYTERTLGFDTAVNNAVAAVDNMRQTMEANDRGFVVEAMGRRCGQLALQVAVAVSAHALGVLETGITLKELVDDVKRCVDKGVESPVIVISEGVSFSVKDVEELIQKKLKIQTRSAILGYIQRGGKPSVTDRLLATQFGVTALELLREGQSGLAVGIANNSIISVPIDVAVNTPATFNMELYNQLRALHRLD